MSTNIKKAPLLQNGQLVLIHKVYHLPTFTNHKIDTLYYVNPNDWEWHQICVHWYKTKKPSIDPEDLKAIGQQAHGQLGVIIKNSWVFEELWGNSDYPTDHEKVTYYKVLWTTHNNNNNPNNDTQRVDWFPITNLSPVNGVNDAQKKLAEINTQISKLTNLTHTQQRQ
jgi:hypothetical protein